MHREGNGISCPSWLSPNELPFSYQRVMSTEPLHIYSWGMGEARGDGFLCGQKKKLDISSFSLWSLLTLDLIYRGSKPFGSSLSSPGVPTSKTSLVTVWRPCNWVLPQPDTIDLTINTVQAFSPSVKFVGKAPPLLSNKACFPRIF